MVLPELCYPGKKSKQEIFESINPVAFTDVPEFGENLLILGDCRGVLKALLPKFKGKIDLVYIDPPFSTRNVFRISSCGRANPISQRKEGEVAYSDTLTGVDYLEFIRETLYLIYDLLSEQGSIYFHIDYKIGHYVKIVLDEIFGFENFRNDITRVKCNPKNFRRKGYGNIKDLILFYTKSKDFIWNEPYIPYTEEDIKRLFPKVDENGRRYTTIPLHAPGETKNGKTAQPFKGILPPPGRHWRTSVEILEEWDKQGLIEWSKNGVPRKKIYPEDRKGKRAQDIWEFKDPQYPSYPTEKNLDLLKFIIKTSSNENSYVLDCFCGSGTTLVASSLLNRKWIGIDASEKAIEVARERLLGVEYQYIEAISQDLQLEVSRTKI